MSLNLSQTVKRLRRDRWRNQVMSVSKALRRFEVSRAGIDGRVWPDDAEYLDVIIDRLTRKRDRLLNKLKETA